LVVNCHDFRVQTYLVTLASDRFNYWTAL
jgi:hypothetical protein